MLILRNQISRNKLSMKSRVIFKKNKANLIWTNTLEKYISPLSRTWGDKKVTRILE